MALILFGFVVASIVAVSKIPHIRFDESPLLIERFSLPTRREDVPHLGLTGANDRGDPPISSGFVFDRARLQIGEQLAQYRLHRRIGLDLMCLQISETLLKRAPCIQITTGWRSKHEP